ncbi:UvrD-helicase domain-containing protein [Nannocystis sp. RBIL2]|uniref:UvrD-helicase domain-containing protein n=1 Tax=Nannocystis sp. RBIL2 TaxID=2996788 RepID=UPI00226F7C3E|nr:UvrD-helicase domain-containing protein [Nannocystis sp. RBIL2]MCY1070513.1 UvrD-helicase domain-containing protein [Nannocystis sp. RBIL2]
MHWTAEQQAILAHPLDAHALVHAAPGAGKTTTLVGRVARLAERVDGERMRVVMFNKAIQETFSARLEAAGIAGVKVTTFDALGLEVLGRAERRGLLTRPLEVAAFRTREWAQLVHRRFARKIESADDIAAAVGFWKAHLVTPNRAACEDAPELVEAYQALEELRTRGGQALQVDFPDMVYTAVAVLRRYPRLLGPIDHLLVDEFQDVNPARVELLRLLMHEHTTLMAVGDADQAIYEFSGAHPRFFHDFAATFTHRPTRTYPLSHSFRFGETIAAAARALIAHNDERFPIEVVGRGAVPGTITRTDDVPGTITRLLAAGHRADEIAVLYRGRLQGTSVLAELAARQIGMETDDLDFVRKGRGPELALAYLRFATSDAPIGFDDAWNVVFAPDRYIRKEAFADQVRKLGSKGLRAVLGNKKAARDADQPRGAIESMSALADLLARMGKCRTAAAALDLLVSGTDVMGQLAGRKRSEVELDQAVAGFEAVRTLLKGLAVAPAEAAQRSPTSTRAPASPPSSACGSRRSTRPRARSGAQSCCRASPRACAPPTARTGRSAPSNHPPASTRATRSSRSGGSSTSA